MTTRISKASPQSYARIGGIIYLMIIVLGVLGEIFVRGTLVIPGDAMATANNIMTSQSLWRIGITGDIMMHVFDIPLMLVFYILLKPVNKNLALMVILFNLIQTAVLVANKSNLLMSLFLLENFKSFEPGQLNTLVNTFVKLHDYGFGVGLIFFGFECLIVGYLIFRSGYFPKILGVGMQIAGLSYLVNSFALLLAPAFAMMIYPAILLPPFLAELSLCLWLLLKGVNVQQWEKYALSA